MSHYNESFKIFKTFTFTIQIDNMKSINLIFLVLAYSVILNLELPLISKTVILIFIKVIKKKQIKLSMML